MNRFIKEKILRIKSIVKRKGLNMLIFFVTSKCNSRCKTCFYWQNLNTTPDVPVNKIENLSKNLGNFKVLLLSGGEPFLRDDLLKLVKIFIKNNKIENLVIPTNGILTGKILKTTELILRENPQVNISISLSLDGLERTHNYLRGVKNNFKMVVKTLKALLTLKKRWENLNVVINTVICKNNYKEIIDLALYIKKNFVVDGHFFEIVRGAPQEKDVLDVPKEKLADIYNKVFLIQEEYFKRSLILKNLGKGVLRFLRHLVREEEFLGTLLYQYKTQFENYAFGRKWGVPCLAGKTIKVLDANGEFMDCELRKKRGKNCFCTHVCFINISSQYNWKTYFFEFPYLWLRYKLFKKVL